MRRLVLLCALLVLVPVSAARANWPGRNGPVAWGLESFRSSDPALVEKLPGKPAAGVPGAVRTSDDPLVQLAASPSGRTLAWASGYHLGLIGIDGTGQRKIRTVSGLDNINDPAFSPDGRRLAYTVAAFDAPAADDQGTIWLTRLATKAQRRLVTHGRWPAWGASNRIAFTRAAICTGFLAAGGDPFCNGGALFTIRPDGSGLRRVTRDDAERPDWSPHASRIAFLRYGDAYTVKPDGTGLRRVTHGQDLDSVIWSPDGTALLLYAKGPELDPGRLLLVRAGGGTPRVVARGRPAVPNTGDEGAAIGSQPAWARAR